jgi:hypothetical protein
MFPRITHGGLRKVRPVCAWSGTARHDGIPIAEQSAYAVTFNASGAIEAFRIER